MNLFSQTRNGHRDTVSEDLSPGQTLNLELPSAQQTGPLTTTPKPRASLATIDAFRTLALTVETLVGDLPIRSIALLSAVPGEGRSLSAELLSQSFSELRPPVRLIEGDPFQRAVRKARSPRLRVGRKNFDGLVEQEDGYADLAVPSGVLPAFERVPVGRGSYPGPSAFLEDVRKAIDAAVALQAVVFVDAPACNMSSLGFSIAQMVDAVIYVVRPDASTLETHQEVLDQLLLLKVRVLGTVLNEG